MSQLLDIPRHMKALRLVNFNAEYEIHRDVPVPLPRANEVLIKVAAAGFCHTDYQVYEGAYQTPLPHTGSHEPVGTIVALGSNVLNRRIGDRVGAYVFREACGKCSDCAWHASSHFGSFNARFCKDNRMVGVRGADGGFAEYLLTSDDAIVAIPENLAFEQAAPLMCAGATVWSALIQADIKAGQTIAIVGMGALGHLAIKFAKALNVRVIAVSSREIKDGQFDKLGKNFEPDLAINFRSEKARADIAALTCNVGIDAAVVCTDNLEVNDWILHQLHPKGIAVVLGLPVEGYRFDAFNIVFREIVIKGSIVCSKSDMETMMKVVVERGISTDISMIPFEEAADLPEKAVHHHFTGKPVVMM